MAITNQRLNELVQHFQREWIDGCIDPLIRFKTAPDLGTAIKLSAHSETSDGKIEPHQRRVGKPTLRKFERKLQRHRRQIEACRSFDQLYQLINHLRIPRIGALTVYDISTRLGAYLKLAPEQVYLHTGALAGARALGYPGRRIRMQDLPAPLQAMTADDIESFLCLYKNCFDGRARLPRPRNGRSCRGANAGIC